MRQYPCYSVCLVLSQVLAVKMLHRQLYDFVLNVHCLPTSAQLGYILHWQHGANRTRFWIYSNGVQWRYNTSWWPLVNLHLLSLVLSQSHFIHSKKQTRNVIFTNISACLFVLTLKNVQFCASFLTCLYVAQQCIPPHSECSENDRYVVMVIVCHHGALSCVNL